jgi:hypothetical protein
VPEDESEWESPACASPPPDLQDLARAAWTAFVLSDGATNYQGMDGIPRRRFPTEVAKVYEAMGVTWEERSLALYRTIENVHQEAVQAELDRRKKPD